jgi:hypothetical protein
VAPAQHENPRLDDEQVRVLASDRVGKLLEPGNHSRVSSVLCVREPRALDELAGFDECLGFQRMLDRFVDRPALPVPGEGPPMQGPRKSRLTMLELDSEQLREEVMEAVPRAAVVEWDQEEIRPRKLVEQPSGAVLFEHRVAQRATEALQDR